MLGMHTPTDHNFQSFISDVDGEKYHYASVYIANHYNFQYLSEKYSGGLFPKIVATFYVLFGKNPFLVCCMNSLTAGLLSVIIYLLGNNVLKNKEHSKIYALFCILCTSFIVNTSVFIRDVYIMLFIYLSIYLIYLFLKSKNWLYFIFTLLSLILLSKFRMYAAIITFIGISFGVIFKNIEIKFKRKHLKINKVGIITIIALPFIILFIVYILKYLLSNTMLLISELSLDSLTSIRESAYAKSTSGFTWNVLELYSIFPLLPFIVGYLCMFFAPFPIEWTNVKRLHYIPDMLILYCFIPSFIKNIKKVLIKKDCILLIFLFTVIIMFTIYCITVGNSGSIYRLRGSYIPMIYLIAMYSPNKFLKKFLYKVEQLRLI